MSVISKGSVSLSEYIEKIDKLKELSYKELGGENSIIPDHGHSALGLAQAAAVFGCLYENKDSKFYQDEDTLKESLRYASLSLDWCDKNHDSLFIAGDFTALALYRFLKACNQKIPQIIKERIIDFIRFCADNIHYEGAYINHNLNTALICEYVYNICGEEQYHKWCKAKTNSSLYYFDQNDGRNPEIAQTYGIYGLSLLAKIAKECQDNDVQFSQKIIPYIRNSAETLPTYYFYDETGDFIAINSRETIKMLLYAPVCWSIYGFEIIASILNDGRYKSIAKFVYDYWVSKIYTDSGIIRIPRWEKNKEAAPFHFLHAKAIEKAGLAEIFSAYSLTRLLDYYQPIQPEKFTIKDKVAGRQFFQRKKIGSSQAVISNVLYSPIAYMTKGGACLVGEELQGEIYRPEETDSRITLPDGFVPVYMRNGNDYQTSITSYIDTSEYISASMYSQLIDVYSTAFFDEENLIWVITISPEIRNAHYDLYLYYDKKYPSKLYSQKMDEVSPGTIRKNLKWVLLSNSNATNDYLAIALLGAKQTNLETKKGIITVNYHTGVNSASLPYSILLVREWHKTVKEFHKWWQKWVAFQIAEGYQVNSPSGNIYLIKHNHQRAEGIKLG